MRYAVKKGLTLLVTMLIVSFLAFSAFEVVAGDPASAMLGTQATEESLEALRLLWCFLDAGISRTLALEAVNRRGLGALCRRQAKVWSFAG